jgi:hypothetical protein
MTPFAAAGAESAENIIFTIDGETFEVPLENINIYDFIKHSLGYTPLDLIRDGLPQFGSGRDDWSGATPRLHQGIDIYYPKMRVVASAAGIVETAGNGKRSGPYLKISHGKGIQILYIHLSKLLVKKGDRVMAGEPIAEISTPQGNGVEPQLHFELKKDGTSIDPLPLIKAYHANNARLIKMISGYMPEIAEKEKLRERLIYYHKKNPGAMLKSQPNAKKPQEKKYARPEAKDNN